MKMYLMTASQAAGDYRFLGSAPRDPFWRRYAALTSFEHPTVLVLGDGLRFQAFLSGIPGARRDRTEAPIRFTLVFRGACRAGGGGLLRRGLFAFLSDLSSAPAAPPRVGILGTALDTTFPARHVERAFAAKGRGAPARGRPRAQTEQRLQRALGSLADTAPPALPAWRFFSGGRASPAARALFLAQAHGVVTGARCGAALAVNLAARGHLAELTAGQASCAVLFTGGQAPESLSEPAELSRHRSAATATLGRGANEAGSRPASPPESGGSGAAASGLWQSAWDRLFGSRTGH